VGGPPPYGLVTVNQSFCPVKWMTPFKGEVVPPRFLRRYSSFAYNLPDKPFLMPPPFWFIATSFSVWGDWCSQFTQKGVVFWVTPPKVPGPTGIVYQSSLFLTRSLFLRGGWARSTTPIFFGQGGWSQLTRLFLYSSKLEPVAYSSPFFQLVRGGVPAPAPPVPNWFG